MLNQFFISATFLWVIISIGRSQELSSQPIPVTAKTFLEQRGFKIIEEKNDKKIETSIIEENSIFKVKVEVSLKDLRISSLSKGSQDHSEILSEDFEGSFPDRNWQLFGDPTWGADDYNPFTGTRSAWCTNGGVHGLDP